MAIFNDFLVWPVIITILIPFRIDQYDTDKIILGTNTSGKESNNIIITNFQKDKISDKNKIYIDSKINFNTPVVKAKQAPKNPNLFSVSATNGEIKIFDYLKYNKKNSFTEAQFFLQGHINKVNGLCWNSSKEGVLISGSDDSKVIF
jgi:WD40 repeat protein